MEMGALAQSFPSPRSAQIPALRHVQHHGRGAHLYCAYITISPLSSEPALGLYWCPGKTHLLAAYTLRSASQVLFPFAGAPHHIFPHPLPSILLPILQHLSQHWPLLFLGAMALGRSSRKPNHTGGMGGAQHCRGPVAQLTRLSSYSAASSEDLRRCLHYRADRGTAIPLQP